MSARRAPLRLLLWPAGVALGIAAEATSYGFGDPRNWVPDAAVGWTLIACGLIALPRGRHAATGLLMTATGAAWFAGNFSDAFLYLHRGPLVQLVLCYPLATPRGRLERAAVAAAYAAALIPAIWDSDVATIALAAALAAMAAIGLRSGAPVERSARLPGRIAALGLSLVLAGAALARVIGSAPSVREPTLLVYELAVCAIAVGLLLQLDRAERARAGVADLVVELGAGSGTLRDTLAAALGDARLEVGYWLASANAYVDAEGKPLVIPAPDADRQVTLLQLGGAPLAALIHDPATLGDPELVEALGTATRLAAANAQLQADVRAQVAEVEASRRRLVHTGDDERRRLQQRLDVGAQRRLEALRGALQRSREDAGRGELSRQVEEAVAQLERTLVDLGELAAGLHPGALERRGLRESLVQLAARFPFTAEVDVPEERLPAELEATAWFVCSEALANVAKHARAARVAITVEQGDKSVVIGVRDDGSGGADPAAGSGLRGLMDRVEALGGRIELSSAAGRGTALQATIPLARYSGQQ